MITITIEEYSLFKGDSKSWQFYWAMFTNDEKILIFLTLRILEIPVWYMVGYSFCR